MARRGGLAVTVLAFSFFLGGCASRQSIPQVTRVTELPTITKTGVQPGDQVAITFYTAAGSELSEVSGERTVDANGEVFLPFLGTVSVLGLDSQTIREMLEDRYGTLYSDPVVEVSTNIHVNVTGAVGRPGRYFLPPSATLVDALALAGGSGSDIDVAVHLPGRRSSVAHNERRSLTRSLTRSLRRSLRRWCLNSRGWTRTSDKSVNSRLLYQLSYAGLTHADLRQSEPKNSRASRGVSRRHRRRGTS